MAEARHNIRWACPSCGNEITSLIPCTREGLANAVIEAARAYIRSDDPTYATWEELVSAVHEYERSRVPHG